MRLIREHINEKFVQDSDPVKDLGIGVFKSLADNVMKKM